LCRVLHLQPIAHLLPAVLQPQATREGLHVQLLLLAVVRPPRPPPLSATVL